MRFRLGGQLSGCCDPCRQPLSVRRLGAARDLAAASIRAQAGKVAVRWSGAGATRPASDGGVVRSGWWPVPTSAPSTAMMSGTSRTVHSSAHEGRATSPRGDVAEPNVAEHVTLLRGAGTQGLILMSARRGQGSPGFSDRPRLAGQDSRNGANAGSGNGCVSPAPSELPVDLSLRNELSP